MMEESKQQPAEVEKTAGPGRQGLSGDIERLATIGTLATKIAHELNNPLDGTLRYINLALRALEQGDVEKPKEYLAQCKHGLMRLVQITSELLEFARSTYASWADFVQVEQIIEDALKSMHIHLEAQNVTVARNYGAGLPAVQCGNLFGVFCNLVKNALDAMGAGGELTISTRLEKQDSLAVAFRDTGSGFDPQDAEAIFEPFYTTKKKGRGTGLGLAICRDILQKHNGTIKAENAPDGGSIFTVYLPAGDQNK